MSTAGVTRAASGEHSEAAARRVDPRVLAVAGLHLAALSAFGLAQPLFDVLQNEPEFFAARGSRSIDIVVFALIVTFGPPAVLLLAETLVGLLSSRFRAVVHLAFVGGLVAVIAVQALKGVDALSSTAVALGALLIGAGGALLYWRASAIRSFLTVLSAAPVLFLAIFLFFSPVSKLVLPDEAQARAGGVNSDTPVVMVIFDEFPLASLQRADERIDAERYPNFARFVGDSTWFRNASGVHDRTTKAVPAILDGKAPKEEALPIAADHRDNLFTMFGLSGYRLNVAEQATRLCPERLCKQDRGDRNFKGRMWALANDLSVVYGRIALPDALANDLPSVSNTLGDFRGEGNVGPAAAPKPAPFDPEQFGQQLYDTVRGGSRAGQFGGWVSAIRSGGRPQLSFAHIFFPHEPFQYYPSGSQYMRGPDNPVVGLARRTHRDEFVIRQTHQRHMLQAEYTDRLLGLLVARLREQGIYDDALIVLLADHGRAFRRGVNNRAVTDGTSGEIAAIPLFVKAPGQKGGRINNAYVRTTDLMPTIADALDVELPWRADGRSGFSSGVRGRDRVRMIQGEDTEIGRSTGVSDVSIEEFERQQAAALRRKLELFGQGDRGLGVFGIGPHRELIGKRTRELGVRGRGNVEARIEGAPELRAVKLGSGFVPGLVAGRVAGPGTPTKRALAYALNGRIVAVGETYSLDGSMESFTALLPERAFREGRNRLEVLEVTGGPGALRLRRLGTA